MINKKLTQNIIVGAGVAGLTLALELLRAGRQVILFDRDSKERAGGLARWAFGGMALCQTNEQKKMGIPDSPELLLRDWLSVANLSDADIWPLRWAETYAKENKVKVYDWLKLEGFSFLPAVNWPERGDYKPGNSVPRYHILWGTGMELANGLMEKLQPFQDSGSLKFKFGHCVDQLISQDNRIAGVSGTREEDGQQFFYQATNTIIATGGINGSIEQLLKHWPHKGNTTKEGVLNGAHPNADGRLHYQAEKVGAQLTNLNSMWNYAAGVAHPQPPFDGHGLSLVPCKSALWMDHRGKRIGPEPMVTGFDTSKLCERLSHLEKPWSWHILNWKIACKELAISGSEHNTAILNKNLPQLLKELLLGNKRLVNRMVDESDEFIVADNLIELADKMNQLTGTRDVDSAYLQSEVDAYDEQYARPESMWNDDQIRRLKQIRQWKSEKLRTLKPSPIQKPQNGPLMAIRLRYINRKSLGGIQTNLSSSVLNDSGNEISGLYAIGEAAGFGGGGACGKSTLEGTFLSTSILTARRCAEGILKE